MKMTKVGTAVMVAVLLATGAIAQAAFVGSFIDVPENSVLTTQFDGHWRTYGTTGQMTRFLPDDMYSHHNVTINYGNDGKVYAAGFTKGEQTGYIVYAFKAAEGEQIDTLKYAATAWWSGTPETVPLSTYGAVEKYWTLTFDGQSAPDVSQWSTFSSAHTATVNAPVVYVAVKIYRNATSDWWVPQLHGDAVFAQTSAVPEPTTMGLVALGGIAGLMKRRK
jgi:hypothetical protein